MAVGLGDGDAADGSAQDGLGGGLEVGEHGAQGGGVAAARDAKAAARGVDTRPAREKLLPGGRALVLLGPLAQGEVGGPGGDAGEGEDGAVVEVGDGGAGAAARGGCC